MSWEAVQEVTALQERIAVLVGKNAALQQQLRSLHEADLVHVAQISQAQDVLVQAKALSEKWERETHLLRRQLESARWQLDSYKALANALKKPCTCAPPGSGDHCNGCCHVRDALEAYTCRAIPWMPGTELLMAFDAAVQAVREGQG